MSEHKHLLAADSSSDGPGPVLTTDKAAAAPAQPKKPREVHVAIQIMSVSSVSNVEQRFSADFVLILRWNDPALVPQPTPTPGSSASSVVWAHD